MKVSGPKTKEEFAAYAKAMDDANEAILKGKSGKKKPAAKKAAAKKPTAKKPADKGKKKC